MREKGRRRREQWSQPVAHAHQIASSYSTSLVPVHGWMEQSKTAEQQELKNLP